MNSITVHEFPAPIRAQIRAHAHAAHVYSRLSVQYRHWAEEAALAGQTHAAERWTAEYVRLRTEASWNITRAMQMKDRGL